MKYLFAMILFTMNMAFANDDFTQAVAKTDSAVKVSEGIDFQEWESQFESSMDKAKTKVRKCESNSKNCQFEKFQALDPSFDMVH